MQKTISRDDTSDGQGTHGCKEGKKTTGSPEIKTRRLDGKCRGKNELKRGFDGILGKLVVNTPNGNVIFHFIRIFLSCKYNNVLLF